MSTKYDVTFKVLSVEGESLEDAAENGLRQLQTNLERRSPGPYLIMVADVAPLDELKHYTLEWFEDRWIIADGRGFFSKGDLEIAREREEEHEKSRAEYKRAMGK